MRGYSASRQTRGVLHVLAALFGIGYLGVSARACSQSCGVRVAIIVAFSAASVLMSLLLAGCLLSNLIVVAKLEWIFDLILLGLWATTVGLTFYLAERGLGAITLLIAFSWVALTLTVLVLLAAMLCIDGPGFLVSRSKCPAGGEGDEDEDGDDEEDPERDATPEIAFVPHTDSAHLQEQGAV